MILEILDWTVRILLGIVVLLIIVDLAAKWWSERWKKKEYIKSQGKHVEEISKRFDRAHETFMMSQEADIFHPKIIGKLEYSNVSSSKANRDKFIMKYHISYVERYGYSLN